MMRYSSCARYTYCEGGLEPRLPHNSVHPHHLAQAIVRGTSGSGKITSYSVGAGDVQEHPPGFCLVGQDTAAAERRAQRADGRMSLHKQSLGLRARAGERMTAKQLLRDGAVVVAGHVAMLRRVSPTRQVIMFHDIENASRFQQCIDWLLERYEIVPVSDLLMDPNLDARDRLALTFDDGYADWHDVVAPILQRHRCAATFFVSSGFVGLSPSQARTFRLERLRRSRELAPLTVSQLRELAAENLFEIGSHTVSHRDLGVPLSPEVLASEIKGDRDRIQDWTGRLVRWFAYPFGGERHLSREATEYVRGAGFRGAFTALPGSVNSTSDPFLLPRQSIDVLRSPRLWSARLNGGYDLFFSLKRQISSFSPSGRSRE
jgi:peptidoglycan/xylan/chitin deacetylase (PgdA/CDA1 family)